MCGRYYVDDDMMTAIRTVAGQGRFGPYPASGRHDVLPSEEAPVLARYREGILCGRMRWGFPRHDGKGLVINARAETARESVMFRDSFLRRRCVIPAGGFYEWNASREKVTFLSGDMPVLFMAGFYDRFGDRYRYVILTTRANRSVADVHARMPLVLDADEVRGWILDDGFARLALEKTPAPLVRRQDFEQQTMRFS